MDSNFADLFNYFTMNSQPQQSATTGSSPDLELSKIQNLQALNSLKLLHQQKQQQQVAAQQHHQQQLQQQQQQLQQQNLQLPFLGLNHFLHGGCTPAQLKNFQIQQTQATSSDANLDRIARFHRSSAALFDAKCYWSGTLPPRSHKIITYSPKVFLGGIPWDLTEAHLATIFKPFGNIKVEWPGKEQNASQPKGYVYIIFESEKQVRALLNSCTVSEGQNSGNYFFKISSKRIKSKEVNTLFGFRFFSILNIFSRMA